MMDESRVDRLVCVAVIAVGLLHVWEVSCHHHALNNLSVAEQKVVSLKTENAFYYSYYEEVVMAPTLGEALLCVLRDGRSEAPDVINAVHRFNIYQELACGLFYRSLRAALGPEWLADPWYFYRGCSYALQGFGHAALTALAASLGGGGLRGGALPAAAMLCWLFLHRRDGGRIFDVGMLALRENWTMPVMLWQVYALMKFIASHPALGARRGRCNAAWLWGLRVGTVVCVLFWQFSAFAFMLQVAALFLCTLLAHSAGAREVCADVLKSHLGCAVLCVLLLFGNELLLHHMLLTECLAILLTLRLRRGPPPWRALWWVDGLFAVGIFAAMRVVQSRWATADEHVGEIFVAKMRQLFPSYFTSKEAEPTFNARLYFAVAVFDFIDWRTLETALPTKLYHFAAAGVAMLASSFVVHVLARGCCCRGRLREEDAADAEGPSDHWAANNQDEGVGGKVAAPRAAGQEFRQRKRAAADSAAAVAPTEAGVDGAAGGGAGGSAATRSRGVDACLASGECADAFGHGVFLVQVALYAALGCFIQRLKVLCVPFLAAVAAVAPAPKPVTLAAAPLIAGRARLRALLLTAAAAAQGWQLLLLFRAMPFLEGRSMDSHQDFVWQDGDRMELYDWMTRHIEAGSIVVASMPMSAELRLNTPFRFVIHPQFEAKSLRDRVQELYEFYMCTPPERVADTMRRYGASYFMIEYKRCDFSPFFLDNHPELNCKKGERPWTELFCPAAHVSPLFRVAFVNAAFAVLKLRTQEQADKEVARRGGLGRSVHDRVTWEPLLERCIREEGGDRCAGRFAELGVMFATKLKQAQIAKVLLDAVLKRGSQSGEAQYIIGRHMDYDLKNTKQAGDHYQKAHRLAPNNPLILREYLLWLDIESQDTGTLERILRPRRHGRGSHRSILELEDAPLACEASVTARNLMRDARWAEELWDFAVEEGLGTQCVRVNWKFHHDIEFADAHSDWDLFWNVFVHRRMRSELVSVYGSGVRFQAPRPQGSFGLQGIFSTPQRSGWAP